MNHLIFTCKHDAKEYFNNLGYELVYELDGTMFLASPCNEKVVEIEDVGFLCVEATIHSRNLFH